MKRIEAGIRLLFVCSFLCVASSCATVSEKSVVKEPVNVQPLPKPEEAQRTASEPPQIPYDIDRAQKDIILGSPRSIQRALDILEKSGTGARDTEEELMFAASRLMKLLYPEIQVPKTFIQPDPTNPIVSAFQTVEEGKFVPLALKQYPFLSLVIPSLVALTSKDEQVVSLCAENLRRAKEQFPRSVIPPYMLGLLAERSGEYETAASLYEEAVAVDDSCYPAAFGIAKLDLAAGNFESTIARFNKYLKDNRLNVSMLATLAEAWYRKGDMDEALVHLQRALQMDPTNNALLTLRARILGTMKKWTQLKAVLGTLERNGPLSEEMVLLKARALYLGEGNAQEALAALSKGIVAYPESADLFEMNGQILFAIGNTDTARLYLEKALALDPSRTPVLELLLADSLKTKRWEKAETYVEILLNRERTPERIKTAYMICANSGKKERALAYAREYAALKPDSVEYSIPLMFALLDFGRQKEAQPLIEASLAKDVPPKVKSDLHFLRSKLQADDNQRLLDLRASIFENPENVQALREVAELYVKQKDFRKAYLYMKQASSLVPDDTQFALRLKEIEALIK